MKKYLDSSKKCYEQIIENIKLSNREILLCYFSASVSVMFCEIVDLLTEKAKRGVKIKILVDDFGSAFKLSKKYLRSLAALGIEVKKFNKLFSVNGLPKTCRLHVKAAVFDGERCVFNGLNLEDKYVNEIETCGHWKESGLFADEKLSKTLQKSFYGLWNGNYALLDGAKTLYINDSENKEVTKLIEKELAAAKKSVVITTPYVVPTYKIVCELIRLAENGVKVTLIIPKRPDKRAVYCLTLKYADILRMFGVDVKIYGRGFIHQKTVLVDGKRAIAGSMNLDYGSLRNNIEECVAEEAVGFVNAVKKDLKRVLSECENLKSKLTVKERITAFLMSPFKKLC